MFQSVTDKRYDDKQKEISVPAEVQPCNMKRAVSVNMLQKVLTLLTLPHSYEAPKTSYIYVVFIQ